jgi:hypothetical protein
VDTPTREAACMSRGERVRVVRSFADIQAGMVGTVYSVVPGPTVTYVVCFDGLAAPKFVTPGALTPIADEAALLVSSR